MHWNTSTGKIGYVDLSSLVNFGFGYMLNENCREKVDIPASMAYVTLEGEGAEKTIIEWDDTADRKGKNGKPLGTYASATVAVNSPYFIAKNIAFKVSKKKTTVLFVLGC